MYRFGIYTPTGTLISSCEAYSNALGIKSFALHRAPLSFNTALTSQSSGGSKVQYPLPPLQQLLAVGSYDGKVRLVSQVGGSLAPYLTFLPALSNLISVIQRPSRAGK